MYFARSIKFSTQFSRLDWPQERSEKKKPQSTKFAKYSVIAYIIGLSNIPEKI